MIPRKFRYVIINDILPRIGSEGDKHADMSRCEKVTSAGFGRLELEIVGEDVSFNVTCWGESVGLGIKSNPETDARLIRQMFCEAY